MKYCFKKIICICMALSIIVALSGCNKADTTNVKKFDVNADYYSVDKEIVAQNSAFAIYWNDETGEIKFYDKKAGCFWTCASLRNETDEVENILPQMKSPIIIKYYNGVTNKETQKIAYTDSLRDGDFSATLIDNGICVTYYFSDEQISVPVNYTLSDDCFSVSINPKSIREGENRIYSISIMPFLCSVNNLSSDKENYLFVPSGSGSLIYPKELGDGVASIISESVYGEDCMNGAKINSNSSSIKMPVFGVKNGNSALCAIISNGADYTQLETNIGSSTYGYSCIYPVFNVRGAFYCESTYMKWYTSKQFLYSKNIIDGKIKIDYYSLLGEKANYMGMAECYRNYLYENSDTENVKEDNLLNVKITGGTEVTEFTAGIPHSSFFVMTDFSDVSDILTELESENNLSINAVLTGFGKYGDKIGKIGGGFAYNKKFGSLKQLKNVQENKKINLYFNFDILRFGKNGSGISAKKDSAFTVLNEKNYIFGKDIVSYENNTSSGKYLYVARDNLVNLAATATKRAKEWGFDGVSFDTLTYQIYSDYRNNQYNSCGSSEKQVSYILEKTLKSKLLVAGMAANNYAAVNCSHIFDVPTESNKYQIYDVDIPFYQIVYKGYVPMSVSALNCAPNWRTRFLQAVETGSGLQYTLIKKYDTALLYSNTNSYVSAVYDNIKDLIASDISEYNQLYKKTAGAKIIDHSLVSDDCRMTVYDNGVTVFVNYGEEVVNIAGANVPAKGFLVKNAGE